MVDISITIPSLNITKEEHFCFKYFNYHNGSPHTLVPHILKEAVGTIYKYYFVNNLDPAIVASRTGCVTTNVIIKCEQAEDEGVDANMKLLIPQWFMEANYPEGCLVPCFKYSYCSIVIDYMWWEPKCCMLSHLISCHSI